MAFKHKAGKAKDIHAYICTPAYDGKVESDYSQSMAEAAFCAPLYGIRITAGVMGNGAFIDLARNVYVKKNGVACPYNLASDFFQLSVGSNTLTVAADSGVDNMTKSITWKELYRG